MGDGTTVVAVSAPDANGDFTVSFDDGSSAPGALSFAPAGGGGALSFGPAAPAPAAPAAGGGSVWSTLFGTGPIVPSLANQGITAYRQFTGQVAPTKPAPAAPSISWGWVAGGLLLVGGAFYAASRLGPKAAAVKANARRRNRRYARSPFGLVRVR
jgi:hypothetical protein